MFNSSGQIKADDINNPLRIIPYYNKKSNMLQEPTGDLVMDICVCHNLVIIDSLWK